MPTPNPSNTDWVEERLDALIALYNITDAGSALLRSLDVRHMRGEPGWFGSFGYEGWVGVGEAKPSTVMHEISHSYWGGIPIDGHPEATWEIPAGDTFSPGMLGYHADVLAFMAQPPDHYEVFRQRLRNIPGISTDNTQPLFHSVEADLVDNTGGNLTLVPPILRKYWSQFLRDGPFGSWYDAVAWYQSLSDEDRNVANGFVGFEHLDLREYQSASSFEDKVDLIAPRREILAQEERQRLFDLADQFDLLLGEPQREENFQFWRGYLRDKRDLHRRHRDYLASLELPRADELGRVLEFLVELQGRPPTEQAQIIADELLDHPFLENLLPALDNRILLALFASGAPIPEGVTLQATASFVERLKRFSGMVDRVLANGRDNPQQGADSLERFLAEVPFEQVDDLRLFFELFRDADPDTSRVVARALDKDTILRLMKPAPADLRSLLSTDELLEKLDITAEAGFPDFRRGITALLEEPSGNFIIDEPFLHRMFEIVGARSRAEPIQMIDVLQETRFPLEGFIQRQPRSAVALLDSDLETAVHLVRTSDTLVSPPARIIYRLIYADPVLAARITHALDQLGEAELVVDSLAYLAYDKARSEKVPGLPISLERDGRFLGSLLRHQGADGLGQRLDEVFTIYGDRIASNDVPADFLAQYRSTLYAAVDTILDITIRSTLNTIIDEVAAEHGGGP